MIVASGVEFAYGERRVLAGVDLRAGNGEVLGLVGPNGSGKTTLLRTLYGALRPRAGVVHLDGEELTRLPAREIFRKVAVVVQETSDDLSLLVSDMVLLGRTPHRSGFARTSGRDDEIAASALAQVEVLHPAGQAFSRLSGERQRVPIARALAQEADHLLLDEPTNHLDDQHEVLTGAAPALRAGGGGRPARPQPRRHLRDRVVLLDDGAWSPPAPRPVLTDHLRPVTRSTSAGSAVRRLQLVFRRADAAERATADLHGRIYAERRAVGDQQVDRTVGALRRVPERPERREADRQAWRTFGATRWAPTRSTCSTSAPAGQGRRPRWPTSAIG